MVNQKDYVFDTNISLSSLSTRSCFQALLMVPRQLSKDFPEKNTPAPKIL